MNFPKTGRVTIVDDRIQEAHEIMQGLSKLGVSYSYISGNYEDLPNEEDLPSTRLLILDLNLDSEAIVKSDSDEKIFKSRMFGLLTRIIKKESKYILAVWGKKEHIYYKYLEELFAKDLIDRKPFKTFSLSKAEYFNQNGERINDEKRIIDDIRNILERELNQAPTYQLLSDWENCVHKATNETLNSFNELIEDIENYEAEANNIIYRLSKAYLGNQFEKLDRQERKLEAALLTLNDLFSDSLEKIILSPKSLLSRPQLVKSQTEDSFEGKVNRKLLVSEDLTDKKYTGIIFKSDSKDFKSIFSDSLNRESIKKIDNFKFKNPDRLKGENRRKKETKDFDNFCKKFRAGHREKCQPITLHITPLCDFAQNKWKLARVVEGIIMPDYLRKYLNKNADYLYISEFNFEIDGINCFLILDFRFFSSIGIKELDTLEPFFRIRHPWLSDIQSKILRHINRPGILYL